MTAFLIEDFREAVVKELQAAKETAAAVTRLTVNGVHAASEAIITAASTEQQRYLPTILNTLSNSIGALIAELQEKVPPSTASLQEQGLLSFDVVSLRQQCEELHAENRQLRAAATAHREVADDAVRKLQAREDVIASLRQYVTKFETTVELAAMQGGLRCTMFSAHPPAMPFDVLMAAEAEVAACMSAAATHAEQVETRAAEANRRQQDRYRRIIETKQLELIQLQRYFRGVLSSVDGENTKAVESAKQENEALRQQLVRIAQDTLTEAEKQHADAVKQLKQAMQSEHLAEISAQNTELQYLKSTLDTTSKAVQDHADQLAAAKDESSRLAQQLRHLKDEVLPRSIRLEQQRAEEALAALRHEQDNDLLNLQQSSAAMREEHAALTESKRVHEQERRVLENALDALRRELLSKDALLRDAVKERRELLGRQDAMLKELSDAKVESGFLRYQLDKTSSEEDSLQTRINALERQTRLQLDASVTYTKAVDREADSAHRGMERLVEQLQRLKAEKLDADGNVARLTGEVDRLNGELRVLRKAIEQQLKAAPVVDASEKAKVASPPTPLSARRGSLVVDTNNLRASSSPIPLTTTAPDPSASLAPSPQPLKDGVVVALAASPRGPPTADAGTQCRLLSPLLAAPVPVVVERLSVRAGTKIGHETARLADRLRNASLRAQLTFLRCQLHQRSPADIIASLPTTETGVGGGVGAALPVGSSLPLDDLERVLPPEMWPLPLSTTAAVNRQNEILHRELQDRQLGWSVAASVMHSVSHLAPPEFVTHPHAASAAAPFVPRRGPLLPQPSILHRGADSTGASPTPPTAEGPGHDGPSDPHSPDVSGASRVVDLCSSGLALSGQPAPAVESVVVLRGRGPVPDEPPPGLREIVAVSHPFWRPSVPPLHKMHVTVGGDVSAVDDLDMVRIGQPSPGSAAGSRCDHPRRPMTARAHGRPPSGYAPLVPPDPRPVHPVPLADHIASLDGRVTRDVIDPASYFDVRPATNRAARLAQSHAGPPPRAVNVVVAAEAAAATATGCGEAVRTEVAPLAATLTVTAWRGDHNPQIAPGGHHVQKERSTVTVVESQGHTIADIARQYISLNVTRPAASFTSSVSGPRRPLSARAVRRSY